MDETPAGVTGFVELAAEGQWRLLESYLGDRLLPMEAPDMDPADHHGHEWRLHWFLLCFFDQKNKKKIRI